MPATNQKYFIGSVVNGWVIVRSLGGQAVEAQCPVCGLPVPSSRASSLRKKTRCKRCKDSKQLTQPNEIIGGWLLVENYGQNRCKARCLNCKSEYPRKLTGLKSSPGCRKCFPTNKKHDIGSIVAGKELVKFLPNKRIVARCLRCGDFREISMSAFCSGSDGCKACHTPYNKKYKVGDLIENWKLLEQVSPSGIFKVQCTGPKCNGAVFYRRASSLTSKGCRMCFPFIWKEESRALACKRAAETKRKQFENEVVGKTYGWIRILGLNGLKARCECLGGGPHHYQGEFFEKLLQDVVQGKTSSCGCMRRVALFNTRSQLGQVVNRVGEQFGHLTAIEKLDGSHYLCRCVCGDTTEVFVGNLLNEDVKSCGCKKAQMAAESRLKNGTSTYAPISRGQIDLQEFIESLGFIVTRNKPIQGIERYSYFEIDAHVEAKRVGFEFHGEKFHHSNTACIDEKDHKPKDRKYHYHKMKAAQQEGIRLIQIFSWEWLHRQNQLKSFIRSVLGANQKTVGARSLEFRECSFADVRDLLNLFHIQKASSGSYHIGVFKDDTIVAAAVFRKHHVRNSGIEMSRWVVRDGFSLPGALTKVSQMASRHFKEDILTWADRRFSEGRGYTSAGWELDEVLPEDYIYFDPRYRRNNQIGRWIYKNQRRRSKVNTPAHMTEVEHASADGLYQIFDCGKIRFIYRYQKLIR